MGTNNQQPNPQKNTQQQTQPKQGSTAPDQSRKNVNPNTPGTSPSSFKEFSKPHNER